MKISNDDYESLLLQAEKSATSKEKIEYCTEAIQIKPTNTKAYFSLIDAYKEDAVFSLDEEAQFKSCINNKIFA